MFTKKGFIAILLIVVLGGAFWFATNKGKSDAVEFITAPVTRGEIRSTVLASGKVRAVSTVNVGTQTSGTIKEMFVDYNSEVKKGDLIALIDPSTAEMDVAQAQAALNAIQADTQQAQANLEYKKKNLRRAQELHNLDLIAAADLDTEKNAVATAQAQVAAYQAKQKQQRAALRRSKIQLGYTRIYSPVNGVIVSKNVDAGQTVAASFNTPTLVEIAENLEKMQVEIDVDEADIGKIEKGISVEFTVDSFPEKIYRGEVQTVRLAPQENNNVVSYTVIVPFYNEGQRLKPGMTANVSFLVDKRENVLTLPNAAFLFRPLDPSKKSRGGTGMPLGSAGNQEDGVTPQKKEDRVYTLVDGKPRKIEVKRGVSDGARSEVLSGVKEGQSVIVGIEAPKDK